MTGILRGWRRKKLLKQPFPAHWEAIVQRWHPFATTLEGEEAERFRTRLKLFVWEKHWVGAGGADVTEEMKVVVAACAARMGRNLPMEAFDRLAEIVVYPAEFVRPGDEEPYPMDGEAHHFGTVVLSWDGVVEGLEDPYDGFNPVIHELAHVLDVSNGYYDGTPLLEHGADYARWQEVMSHYFEELRGDPDNGFLDAYGCEDEAEFFAVATEAFFEMPDVLLEHAPDLYEVLHGYYRVDPVHPPPDYEPPERLDEAGPPG